jgi:hypothetical protein
LDETREPLAAIRRAGNASANNAEDHFTALALALAQIHAGDLKREMLLRTDIGGCTHAFTGAWREARIP